MTSLANSIGHGTGRSGIPSHSAETGCSVALKYTRIRVFCLFKLYWISTYSYIIIENRTHNHMTLELPQEYDRKYSHKSPDIPFIIMAAYC